MPTVARLPARLIAVITEAPVPISAASKSRVATIQKRNPIPDVAMALEIMAALDCKRGDVVCTRRRNELGASLSHAAIMGCITPF